MISKFLAHKSRRVTPRLGFLVPSQNAEERHNGLERHDRTWNGVRGLESLHLATNWFNIEVSCNKSRTVMPQTRFLGSIPKRRRKEQWPSKGRSDLERAPRPRKLTSTYWVVRSRSFLQQKPNGDAPDSVSWFRPKTPKERQSGLERNDRT